MRRPAYREGLARISDRIWCYLQPDGGLGLSNAGLVAPREQSAGALLVDTFFDLAHTRRLLDAIASQVGAPIRRVVNTHHNGDHCWGNQLLPEAEIVGHCSVPADMAKLPPAALQALRDAPGDLPGLAAMREGLARFDFSGIELTPPTRLFDERLELEVDGLAVELLHVGPAHTTGDVIVHVPAEGVIFAGDVLFRLCTPLGWEGTFARWIAALERIAGLGAHTIVPGHGPLCGPEGALEMRDYLTYVREESARRFAAGMPAERAAAEIDLGPYAGWLEPERIVFQVDRAYRELRGEPPDAPIDFLRLAGEMERLRGR